MTAKGAISNDCFCPGCEYNLRGLSPHDLCPECQRPVSEALNRSWWGTRVPGDPSLGLIKAIGIVSLVLGFLGLGCLLLLRLVGTLTLSLIALVIAGMFVSLIPLGLALLRHSRPSYQLYGAESVVSVATISAVSDRTVAHSVVPGSAQVRP